MPTGIIPFCYWNWKKKVKFIYIKIHFAFRVNSWELVHASRRIMFKLEDKAVGVKLCSECKCFGLLQDTAGFWHSRALQEQPPEERTSTSSLCPLLGTTNEESTMCSKRRAQDRGQLPEPPSTSSLGHPLTPNSAVLLLLHRKFYHTCKGH